MDGIRRMAGALLALALATAPLSAQQAREAPGCRCVDEEGEDIEGCVCIAPGVFERVALASRAWTARARIGVRVDGGQGSETDARGVRVVDVVEDGPAAQGGLREGDLVVSVNGRSVLDPLPEEGAEDALDDRRSLPVQRFLAFMADAEPGDEVRVEYRRDGSMGTAIVVAEENPRRWGAGAWPMPLDLEGLIRLAPDSSALEQLRHRLPRPGDAPWAVGLRRGDRDALARLRGFTDDPCLSAGGAAAFFPPGSCIDGVELLEMSAELGEYFDAEEGVLVVDVLEGATLGLRPGDVVVAVGEREVETPEDVARILRSYETDEEVRLRVVRKGSATELMGRRR